MGDAITVVTKKAEQQHGEWITTGGIRVRFPSARAAGSTYEQQRSQHHNMNTHADHLLGHTRQVCPTLILTRYFGETTQDDALHKAFFACANFRGKYSNNLLQIFRDNLHEPYDRLYDIDAEHLSQLEDFYTALSDSTKTAKDNHYAALNTFHTLYLFEFYKIVKIGGINIPCACIEWPRIQIPQAVLSVLD